MIDHNDFHDAAIKDIVIKLENKNITIHLRGYLFPENRSYNDIQIIFQNFQKLTLPRFCEWGPCKHYRVLDIEIKELSDKMNKYLIQIQSGDMLEIEAENYLIIDEEQKDK